MRRATACILAVGGLGGLGCTGGSGAPVDDRPLGSESNVVATRTLHLVVRGMSCEHCVAAVQKGLAGTEGVVSARVTLKTGLAEVDFDPARTSEDRIVAAIRHSGPYQVDPITKDAALPGTPADDGSPHRPSLLDLE